jgi:hypothetical protein
MRKLVSVVIVLLGLASLSGCVVYEPAPRVYAYPAYAVYDGPAVVYYRGGYYHHGYYR